MFISFSHCCDQIPGRVKLREEGCVWVPDLDGIVLQTGTHGSQGTWNLSIWWREMAVASLTAVADRKPRART